MRHKFTISFLMFVVISVTSLLISRPVNALLVINDFWLDIAFTNVQSSRADIIYHERNSGFAFYWEEGPTFENDGHMFGDVGGFIDPPLHGFWNEAEYSSYMFWGLQDAHLEVGTTEPTGMESFDIEGHFSFAMEFHDPLGQIQYAQNYSLGLQPMTFNVYETPDNVWVEPPDIMPSVDFQFYGKNYGVVLLWDGSQWNAEMSLAPIPEPATILLIGTGLVGLVGFRKKFKK